MSRPGSKLFAVAASILAIGCAVDGDPDIGGQPGKADDLTEDRAARVIDEIEEFNAGLSAPDRAAKYCKMASSPFVFYRGTNHLFWMDFAGDPRVGQFGNSRTRIWLEGDLHAYNFGSFDNDRGKVVYDLNDFDESVIADYQYDLWRLAVSAVLVADENGGFATADVDEVLDALSESYLDTIASFRGNDSELDAAVTASSAFGLLDEFLEDVEENGAREAMLDKWAPTEHDGERRFDVSNPKLELVTVDVAAEVEAGVGRYAPTTAGDLPDQPEYFVVKDVARRVLAGTGSLGTIRYYVLIEGSTRSQNDDRILDVKRQGPPSASQYLPASSLDMLLTAADSDAARVVLAQRALAVRTDDHLGVIDLSDGAYSVRERSPFKDSFPTEDLTSTTRFVKLAQQWAAILAAAHARADKDFDPELIDYSFDKQVDVSTNGAHQEFRALLRTVALSYAARVGDDYVIFVDHVETTGLVCE